MTGSEICTSCLYLVDHYVTSVVWVMMVGILDFFIPSTSAPIPTTFTCHAVMSNWNWNHCFLLVPKFDVWSTSLKNSVVNHHTSLPYLSWVDWTLWERSDSGEDAMVFIHSSGLGRFFFWNACLWEMSAFVWEDDWESIIRNTANAFIVTATEKQEWKISLLFYQVFSQCKKRHLLKSHLSVLSWEGSSSFESYDVLTHIVLDETVWTHYTS